MIKTLTLKTKRFNIQIVEKGKPIGHPTYIEKGILTQIWENYIKPLFILLAGITIGVMFE